MKLFNLSYLCTALCLAAMPALASVTEFDAIIAQSKTHHSQIIKKDNTYAFQDSITGEILTPFYKSITCWSENEPCVIEQKTDKTVYYDNEEFPIYHQGVINWRGKIIIKPEYQSATVRTDGHIFVSDVQNNHTTYALFDNTGKTIVPFGKRFINHFSEGVATFFIEDDDPSKTGLIDRQYGLIDNKGKELIPAKYDNLDPSNFGLLHAEITNQATGETKHGFINKQDKIKIPFIYQYAETFSKTGFAMVAMDKKLGFINTKGDVVIPIIYDEGLDLNKNHFLVKKANKHSIIDDKNNPIISMEDSQVRILPLALLLADKNNKDIVILFYKKDKAILTDSQGKIIIESDDGNLEAFNEKISQIYLKTK